MKCPRCNTKTLKETSYESYNIEKCSGCSGIWLSSESLANIIETKEVTFSPEAIRDTISSAFMGIPKVEVETHLACPVCTEHMTPVNFAVDSGVIIDNCSKNHGLWFDKGELEKVQQTREYWSKNIEQNEDFFIAKLRENDKSTSHKNNDQSILFILGSAVTSIVDTLFSNKK
jgi:Zn-finger nucleic acid-binding protein